MLLFLWRHDVYILTRMFDRMTLWPFYKTKQNNKKTQHIDISVSYQNYSKVTAKKRSKKLIIMYVTI